jgi:isocitrate/isopropylmalate dehydrogenase
MAQAQHGSAPDIAGRGIANPTSLILSAAMLLDWRGRLDGRNDLIVAGAAMVRAVDTTLDNNRTRTRDIGGSLGTAEYTAALVAQLRSSLTAPVVAK